MQAGDRRPGRSNHAEGLLPLIDEVLQRAGTDFSSLSLVGVAVGPGSFTGLRIGISTAKGLVYGSDTPVVGVRTLEAAAYRVPAADGTTLVCPMLDARKGEVYGALYRRTAAAFECLIEDCLEAPESMVRRVDALAKDPCVFVGPRRAVLRGSDRAVRRRPRPGDRGNGVPEHRLRRREPRRREVPHGPGDRGRAAEPPLHTPSGRRSQEPRGLLGGVLRLRFATLRTNGISFRKPFVLSVATRSVAKSKDAIYSDRPLPWCLVNSQHNPRVFFAVGCVALPRVVPATRAGLKPAPTSHRALATTKNPARLITPI